MLTDMLLKSYKYSQLQHLEADYPNKVFFNSKCADKQILNRGSHLFLSGWRCSVVMSMIPAIASIMHSNEGHKTWLKAPEITSKLDLMTRFLFFIFFLEAVVSEVKSRPSGLKYFCIVQSVKYQTTGRVVRAKRAMDLTHSNPSLKIPLSGSKVRI